MIFFHSSCGVGMSYNELHDCAGMTDEEIAAMSWELGIQCAESFGTFYGEDVEAAEEDTNDMFHGARNFTNEDIGTYWEEYDAEKHDGIL